LPLSSFTNVHAWEDKRWMELFEDLGTYSHDIHIFGPKEPPNVHRKGWEWVQTVYGLDRLGMIKPDYRAIGIGAGRECVIFWLADRISHVVATDLYGNETWTSTGGHEADPAVLDDPQQFCPRPIRREALEFKVMDGMDLSAYEDATFDIAWSLSSIEHFGSHENSAKAVCEMARVVKPGGVVVIATECLLLPEQTHDEFFSRSDIQQYVIGASPRMELIEEVDWEWPPAEYLLDSIVFPHQAHRTRRHIVLNDGIVQWTSVLAFFRRK
jgi:SAM-dependent methyltransferase